MRTPRRMSAKTMRAMGSAPGGMSLPWALKSTYAVRRITPGSQRREIPAPIKQAAFPGAGDEAIGQAGHEGEKDQTKAFNAEQKQKHQKIEGLGSWGIDISQMGRGAINSIPGRVRLPLF